jgi:hypothetical protein
MTDTLMLSPIGNCFPNRTTDERTIDEASDKVSGAGAIFVLRGGFELPNVLVSAKIDSGGIMGFL